jgi:hypothetical protein
MTCSTIVSTGRRRQRVGSGNVKGVLDKTSRSDIYGGNHCVHCVGCARSDLIGSSQSSVSPLTNRSGPPSTSDITHHSRQNEASEVSLKTINEVVSSTQKAGTARIMSSSPGRASCARHVFIHVHEPSSISCSNRNNIRTTLYMTLWRTRRHAG